MNSTGHGEVVGESHVRLLVKAPDQEINDQTVKCTLDWTVAKLKDHLAQVYPSKPKREEQKIIFSGQLLNDTMVLKDVLQHYCDPEDSPFIVHLVCGGQYKNFSSSKNVTSGASGPVNVNQTPTIVSPPTAPTQQTPVQQYYSQLNNQQMAWMQHAYDHYLTRYMQIMAAQGIQVESAPLYNQPMNASVSEIMNNNNATISNNNTNAEDIEVDNDAARGQGFARMEGGRAAGQQQPPIDANVVNNNNNNAAADDAAGAPLNRDWLDIFDMLSRIVVLSSIVYFYSSPSRLFIVSFLGFAIYLIQGGFFRGQPAFLVENNNARVVDNNNQVGANEAVPGGQNPAPAPAPAPTPASTPRIPSPTTGDQPVEATRTNLNEENERPGALAFTWTFFSSFFASLIPDQPNVI